MVAKRKKRDIKGSAETNIRQGVRIRRNRERIEDLEREVKHLKETVYVLMGLMSAYMVVLFIVWLL